MFSDFIQRYKQLEVKNLSKLDSNTPSFLPLIKVKGRKIIINCGNFNIKTIYTYLLHHKIRFKVFNALKKFRRF